MKLGIASIVCFCCTTIAAWGQISFSPSMVNFATVFQGTPLTTTVNITNGSGRDLVVEDINAFHTDAFTITDTAFIIAAGGSRMVDITCNPGQNVDYADWLLIKSSSHPEVPHIRLFANGRYTDTYWDPTQNLWNEDLKAAFHTLLPQGALQLTYNDARDKMYMIVDNWKVNGRGASVNTTECIYTGFQAVGYTSRSDAQTNFGLNTEHTMPQSLFNSTLPELSDLHHIFITTDASNSERANKPFGPVASPSWTQGGSKSNSTTFEPRDVQKGPTVRALLWFLFRYQDYQGFICSQEAVLRNWHNLFPPDSIEKKRNADIYTYQHNKNPFVDHPEFMDRIASLCSVDNGNPSPIAQMEGDTLNYGFVLTGDSLDGYYTVANEGRNDLHITNIAVNNLEFSLLGPTSLTVPMDSAVTIPVRMRPSQPGQYFADLTFNTDAAGAASVTVVLKGTSNTVSVQEASVHDMRVWPQPAQNRVNITLAAPLRRAADLSILNLQGQTLRTIHVSQGQRSFQVSCEGLPAGTYLLKLERPEGILTKKIIVE
ncbi:MAG: endonuclease [Bacteroidia bacterium]